MQGSTAAILQSANLFVFCINTPVRWIDPSGRRVELSSNATQSQRDAYDRAITHLNQSEVFRVLYTELQNSGVVITIIARQLGEPRRAHYNDELGNPFYRNVRISMCVDINAS